MPELPEVETIVRDLHSTLPQKVFSAITIHDPLVLRQPGQEFVRRLKGRAIKDITRRGKAVIIHLSSGESLIVQVMMTGQLIVNGLSDRHTRLTFKFSDGTSLLYKDQRRFGQLRVVAGIDEVKYFHVLGPEPLSKDFTLEGMRRGLLHSGRPVKNLLLDHSFVAGIGNIYACEILFRSRLSPKRLGRRLRRNEAEAVFKNIRKVLKEAIRHRGSSMRNYRDAAGAKGRFNERLSVYARAGEPCPACQKPIVRIIQAGRSTFYCRHCQK